jgi:hypothetical protein
LFSRCSVLSSSFLALAGCADPRGAYEDFVARQQRLDAGTSTDGGGPCMPPAPGAVSGTALMAIGTSISPNHPILFYGQIDTPEQDGKTAVVFRYHPLDAGDRQTPARRGQRDPARRAHHLAPALPR